MVVEHGAEPERDALYRGGEKVRYEQQREHRRGGDIVEARGFARGVSSDV